MEKENPRIIGMMIIGRGEGDRWLTEVLEQRKALVDDAILCLNNVDKKTEEIAKSSGFWITYDDREWGVYQPRMKVRLMEKCAKLRPDWILASDADEMYDKYFTREEANKLANTNVLGYNFAVINLWGDEEHYRHDLSFWNIRFWNYKLTKEHDLGWSGKKLHCGLAPEIVYKYGSYAPFLLKHYGLMYEEDRQRKVERYEKYDPKAEFKGKTYYDSLKDEKTIYPFDEDDMHLKVAKDAKKYGYKFRGVTKKV